MLHLFVSVLAVSFIFSKYALVAHNTFLGKQTV